MDGGSGDGAPSGPSPADGSDSAPSSGFGNEAAVPATESTVSFSQVTSAIATAIGLGLAVSTGNVVGAVASVSSLASQASAMGLASAAPSAPSADSLGADSGGGNTVSGDNAMRRNHVTPINQPPIYFVPRQVGDIGFSSELDSVNKSPVPLIRTVTKIIPQENSTYLPTTQNNGIEKSTNWLAVATLAVSVIALFSGK